MEAVGFNMNRKKGILLIVGFLVVGLAGAFVLWKFTPGESALLPPCPFQMVTGFSCPGCGSTRAAHALLHGHLFQAFDFNPLLILFLPFLAYAGLSKVRMLLFGKKLPGPEIKAWAVWSIFGLILVFWVVRNLPWEPFTFLAP